MKPKEMTAGSLFYECQSGLNIEAVCVSTPSPEICFGERTRWSWEARNTQTGEKITYALSEGLEYLGPRIYSAPQYVSRRNETFVFPLVGGEDLVMEGQDPHGLRNPDVLRAWSESLGADGPAIPLKAWMIEASKFAQSTKTEFNVAFIQAFKDRVTESLSYLFEKPKETLYSHGVGIRVEVLSKTSDGADMTPDMVRQALRDRINTMSDEELMLAAKVTVGPSVETGRAESPRKAPEMAM